MVHHNKKEYLNVAAGFDIETTSWKYKGIKKACLYAYVLGLNGKVIFGRTWQDFLNDLNALMNAYALDPNKRILPIYVFNFSYEFQFIRDWLEWIEIFAVDERKPVRALCSLGIEFRDAYILSGMSLARTAKNLQRYKIEKLKGDLDYDLTRHPDTPLTPKEWHYIENDGLSLMAFIQEEIENNGNNIERIPLTKTGYVRRHMKAECYHAGQKGHGKRRKIKNRAYSSYRGIISKLTIEKDEYILMKEGFQGGFTHGNYFNIGVIFNDVSSMDLCSAYPAAMVLENGYPMGKGERLENPSREEIIYSLKCFFCLFRLRVWNVKTKWIGDNTISFSKCRNAKNAKLDNGRIIEADYLEITCTDIDLWIYQRFYSFGKVEFGEFYRYRKGYLPKQFIKGVLNLYAKKTTLKGVEGMEAEYLQAKEMLNSCYGMAVTSIEQPENLYEEGIWKKEMPELEDVLKGYNESKNRFLFYAWGLATTAFVRKTIARGILGIKGNDESADDYIYSDTDSLKFKNYGKHKPFFDSYNEEIKRKIESSSKANGIDISLFSPKTAKGIEKPIGIFENEGGEDGICYRRFETLGAKRYFVEYPEKHRFELPNGEIFESEFSLTISGVNKHAAIPKLVEKAEKEKKDIFEYFKIGFEFNEEMAGKNTHTYIDKAIKGKLMDYLGNIGEYEEKSFIHLEPTTYKLTTYEEYLENMLMDTMERKKRQCLKRM